MSTSFTTEQLEAIERRDGSLFLHANAGSGKTSVLVERFVRAAREDGVDVERILAITFTEKAAAELKARIRTRFLELGDRERARAAEGAWVSTIHGFCSRILRSHPLAAGIDPDYRVLAEAETDRIGSEAFERALEDFLAEDGWGPEWPLADRLELAASYRPDPLGGMVRTVHSRLRSMGRREPALPPLDEPREAGERERLTAAFPAAVAELEPHAEMASVRRELDKIRRCGELLAQAAGLPDPEELATLEPKFGTAHVFRHDACAELADAHVAYAGKALARRQFHDYRLMRELVRLYGGRYEQLKRERSGLDFEDLELLARDLLRDEPALGEQYRERFEHVMVDEFQDTNRLQVELLELVSRDNLFSVGDAAQSIYLFRNADVGVFRERRESARRAGRDARLSASFRGRPELLAALNLAFGGEHGLGADFEPLRVPEGAKRPLARLSPSVELLIVDRTRGPKSRWDEAFPDGHPFGSGLAGIPAWRAAEARLLARRVHELAGPGGPFQPADVAVLVRAGTDIGVYERALAEHGLPTYVSGGRGYWHQQQVTDLRAYLAALANPLDELALLSVLGSPLVGASADALAIVGLRARRLKRNYWWALEQAFCPDGDGSDGLAGALPERDRERVGSFVRRFADERRAAPRISLETLIDRALTHSGYDRRILAMPNGERRMANVRKLMRLAREFEADEGRDLRGFIDFVGEQDLVRAREGEAPLEAEGIDAVRLMTIHAAKGLEFKVVCVADLGRAGRTDDDALRVTPEGRIGLRVASLGGGAQAGAELQAIKEDQDREADAEEHRVFYVAMTRAQEHLVLSGATDAERWPEPGLLGVPIDWIWRALAPDFPQAAAAGGESVQVHEGEEVRVRCVLCAPASTEEALPREAWAPEPAAGAGETPAGVQPPLLAPVEASGAPPVSRLSYSALERYSQCGYRFYAERVLRLRLGEERSVVAATAEAAPEERAADELPALLRGTIVHELLERLDFSRPRIPPAEEVRERLEAHATRAPGAAVDEIRDLVERFTLSELCRRLASARRARRELPFAFTLRPEGAGGRSVLVNGVVDVHAAEPDGVLIVDYKSDPLDGAEPASLVEEKYGTQQLIYALAALLAGAERVEVAHCFLERADDPVSALFGPADRPRLERDLRELASGVVAGRFEPAENPHRELCQFCVARPELCSWPPELTLADRPAV